MSTPAAPRPGTLLYVLQEEPAMIAAFLNSAAALIAAFLFNTDQTAQAAIVTIGAALVTVLTTSLTRPIKLAALSGAIVTGLTAAAAFGLKLQPEVLGFVAPAMSLVAAFAVRLAPDVFALAHVTDKPPA